MSVMICTDRHFNSLQRAVYERVLSARSSMWMPGTIREALNTEAHVATWVDTLRTLNEASYSSRYREHVDPTPRNHAEGARSLTDAGLWSALGCLLYQVEKETIETVRPLTAPELAALDMAERLRNAIAHKFARAKAEAEDQPWSID